MIEFLFQDNRLRYCKVKGIYQFNDQGNLLEILNLFQNAVPKNKTTVYENNNPKIELSSLPTIYPCLDGVLLKGVININGDEERGTIGAIIYRKSDENLNGLYLIKLIPKLQKKSYKINTIQPEIPQIFERYINRIIFESKK